MNNFMFIIRRFDMYRHPQVKLNGHLVTASNAKDAIDIIGVRLDLHPGKPKQLSDHGEISIQMINMVMLESLNRLEDAEGGCSLCDNIKAKIEEPAKTYGLEYVFNAQGMPVISLSEGKYS